MQLTRCQTNVLLDKSIQIQRAADKLQITVQFKIQDIPTGRNLEYGVDQDEIIKG